MNHFHEVQVHIDPDSAEQLPNGVWHQPIELVLTDDPDRPIWKQLPPAVCWLDPARARELAFELLMLAEVAEHWEQAR